MAHMHIHSTKVANLSSLLQVGETKMKNYRKNISAHRHFILLALVHIDRLDDHGKKALYLGKYRYICTLYLQVEIF